MALALNSNTYTSYASYSRKKKKFVYKHPQEAKDVHKYCYSNFDTIYAKCLLNIEFLPYRLDKLDQIGMETADKPSSHGYAFLFHLYSAYTTYLHTQLSQTNTKSTSAKHEAQLWLPSSKDSYFHCALNPPSLFFFLFPFGHRLLKFGRQ